MKSEKAKCSTDRSCETTRREALKLMGAGAAALFAGRLPVMARPFTRAGFEKLVPADKQLHPDWVKSLFARGERTVYRGAELEKIGMPNGASANQGLGHVG